MSKKKRLFIIGGFCLLLAVTGVLNVVLNNQAVTTSKTEIVTTGTFFSNYRDDRNSTYDKEVMYLNAIISSDSSSAEAKANAEAQLETLLVTQRLQNTLEGNIKAKGFTDVVCSALENSISVMVKGSTLTDSEVAQIVEVIETSSDYNVKNIKIIPVE